MGSHLILSEENPMNIQLGFSTGCFYKAPLTLSERLAMIRNADCRATELGLVKLHSFNSDDLDQLSAHDFAGFDHLSMHAPKFDYGDNEGTYKIFERIRRVNAIRTLDWVVIHPDTVVDFSVFQNAGFNVALENMDNRKASYKTPDEFVELLAQNPQFGFVLDVNHIYSNDPSMQLATDFYEKLGDRVTEIHLSGYTGYHEPISETRQLEIMRAIRGYDVPIIVESVLSPEDIEKERDYILRTANEL